MPLPTTPPPFRPATRALGASCAAALLLLAVPGCGAQPPAGARADSGRPPAGADPLPAESNGEVERGSAGGGRRSPGLDRAAEATRAAVALARRAAASRAADGRTIDLRLADSARAGYEAAAELSPPVAEWLGLRAAGMTADPAARARRYAALTIPAARARARWTEATARERFGDAAGAAEAWRALGRESRGVRARLAALPAASGSAAATERAALRDTLLRVAGARSDASDAREAIALLDSAFAPLTPAEELTVARAAAALGQSTRAAAGFARASAPALTTADRYAYASALARLGRYADAAREYDRVRRAGGTLAGSAGYERARALLRAGRGTAASGALAELRRSGDAAAAARALFLLADLASDDGRERDALAAYRELTQRFPGSDLRGPAAFRGATLALALDGRDAARSAAEQLDAIRTLPHEDAIAAGYWAGRAWALAGDSGRARERWRETAGREPRSYYAMLAERRLGGRPWVPPAGAPLPTDPVAEATTSRAALLDDLGLGDEAGAERDWLAAWADSSTARLLAAAAAYERAGSASRGIRLASQALARGATPTVALYRALYPFPYDSLVRAESRRRDVDPAFAAALIRQESSFTPTATSPAGARGLMQVMPAVGRALAGGGAWDPARLYDPAVNVSLGMRHLATSLARYPHPAYALAAYNAGDGRVRRWRQRAGADDPELFVERIPYAETRDYVRIVLRNRAIYEGVY